MSAGQVVVGLLIAFFALLLNFKWCPFAEDSLNTVNTLAQLNLFFFLLVRARARFRLPWCAGTCLTSLPAMRALSLSCSAACCSRWTSTARATTRSSAPS